MSQKIVLMSSPEYFKVEYAINPWMVPGTNIDLELAKNQWNGLKRTIEEAGAEVKVVPPNENHPDLVFTAGDHLNAIVLIPASLATKVLYSSNIRSVFFKSK